MEEKYRIIVESIPTVDPKNLLAQRLFPLKNRLQKS